MKRVIIDLLLISLTILVGLAGCSGSGGDGNGAAVNGASTNAAGTWNGTWHSETSDAQVTVTITMTEQGNKLTGEVAFTGDPCFTVGNFDGDVSGRQVIGHFDFGENGGLVVVDGTFDDAISIFSGHYDVTNGICNGDQGTFLFVHPENLRDGDLGGGDVPGGDNGVGGGDDNIGDEQTDNCCRTCTVGKACGNSCISREFMCHQPPGCACNE